ncbi:hypothetical protein ACFLTH_04845 [Bacteroidota bacterium]
MENKGPVLISYLAQIILIIVLLQVTGFLKWLSIIILLATEVLILKSLLKENEWNFQCWYAFFVFIIILLFLLAQIIPGTTSLTAPLSVEVVVSLILGFFITVFTQKTSEDIPPVKIVEFEPKIEAIEIEEVPEDEIPKKTAIKQELIVSADNSTTYHVPSCRYVENVPKNKIQLFTSRKQASNKGLKACKICIVRK